MCRLIRTSSRPDRAAERPDETCGLKLLRWQRAAAHQCRVAPRSAGARARRPGEPVHAAPGRPRNAAEPDGRRNLTSRSAPRSPAAPARRPTVWSASSSTRWCCAATLTGRPVVPRAAGRVRETAWRPTRTRTCRSSGSWRSWRRRARCAAPAVPGDAGAAEQRHAGPSSCRVCAPAPAGRTATAKFDSPLSLAEPTAATRGRVRLEYATDLFERRDDRPPGRALRDAPRGGPGGAGAADRGAAAARARPSAGRSWSEWNDTGDGLGSGRPRYEATLRRQELFAAQAGRTPEASRWCGDGLGSGADLWRAGRPGRQSRPAPARARRRAGRPWSACASSARSTWSSGCWASSRPAAPMCRSIRAIRPSASPSCSRMHAPRCCSRTRRCRISCPLTAHGWCTSTAMGAQGPVAASPRPRPPAPDNLAYVIYTSGSTGKPKGRQRGIARGGKSFGAAPCKPACRVSA